MAIKRKRHSAETKRRVALEALKLQKAGMACGAFYTVGETVARPGARC